MAELKGSFGFKMGNFEFRVISDGTFPVPDTQPEESLGQYKMQSGQTMGMSGLFIRTGEHTVLVDTGWGVGVEPDAGKLVQNLQRAGIQCSEIDKVILSHAHPDHMGGNTDAEGKCVFPNARFVLWRKEWEFWTSEPDLTPVNLGEDEKQKMVDSAQKNLISIQDRLELVDGDKEIIPGIELIRAPGHTPGHIVLVISSGTEQLLCTCDLFRDPLDLVNPDLCLSFDYLPEEGRRTRMQILSRIAATNPLVFATHFPFPGLGHIGKRDGEWFWQPIEIKGET